MVKRVLTSTVIVLKSIAVLLMSCCQTTNVPQTVILCRLSKILLQLEYQIVNLLSLLIIFLSLLNVNHVPNHVPKGASFFSARVAHSSLPLS